MSSGRTATGMTAVSTAPRRHSPANDSDASHDSAIGDVIVVKTGSSSANDSSSLRSSPDEDMQTATPQSPPTVYPPSNPNDSTHKRKRSGTDDNGRPSPPRQYDYSPPKRDDHPQHVADRVLHVLDTSNGHQQYYHDSNGANHNGQAWDHDQAQQGTPTTNGAEDRWETGQDANGQNYDSTMNGTNGVVPKRKRNFSNRTKTGCLTCRKRKKKCGEERPYCQNCNRGGFPCEGYSTARSGLWPKPAATKPPIPLQSKDGPGEAYDPAQQRPLTDSPSSARPYEGSPLRPGPVDNPQQYAAPVSNEPRNRPPYPGQTWPPQHTQPPYTKDHLPPLAEVNRPDMSGTAPSRDMSRPPTQGAGAPPPMTQTLPHPPQHPPTSQPPQQYPIQPAPPQQHAPPPTYYPPQQEYRQYPPPPPAGPPAVEYRSSSAVSHSRMSSSSYEHQKSGAKTFTVEEIERSRMLRNSHYNHFDPTLENDRQRCVRALARYNAACSIDSGMDAEEARTMLWKVFDPARDTTHRFDAPPREKGTLSHGVRIEAPFTCTYGYNLKVMDNVYIGKGTTIDDAGKVEIGARTWVGPNVTILTSDCSKDMVDRKGAAGKWLAQTVIIESEVVIGANALIYPGVRLGRGSTVEPGAIVKEPLGDNQVQRAADGKRDFL